MPLCYCVDPKYTDYRMLYGIYATVYYTVADLALRIFSCITYCTLYIRPRTTMTVTVTVNEVKQAEYLNTANPTKISVVLNFSYQLFILALMASPFPGELFVNPPLILSCPPRAPLLQLSQDTHPSLLSVASSSTAAGSPPDLVSRSPSLA